MKGFKKLYLLAAMIVCLVIFPTSATTPDSLMSGIRFHGGKTYATVNGKSVELNGEVISVNGCTYIAPEKLLLSCGFGMGWKDDIKAVVAVKNGVVSYIITDSPVLWKGPEKYTSANKTLVYKGIFYIPLDMFTYLTGCQTEIDGNITEVKVEKRDLLSDTIVGNDYRLGGSATPYSGVWLSGNFGMERVSIPNDSAVYYAAIVNQIAAGLPEDVNVYNIVVPTASEFYGPSNIYTNQTAGIKTVYANLSERVTPINAVRPLYEHAGESIYFRTDHHWTQRGAYYVYKEFMDVKDESVPPLSDFAVRTGNYTGSLANFADGTYAETVFRQNPDKMERFLIPTFTAGGSYNDMYMKSYNRSIAAVYENTNSYVAFLGGDNPLSVLTSNVGNGKRLVVIKESFGNAFATWALNNYSEVYVIDVRKFNNGNNRFNLRDFYNFVPYDDLVIINYPVSVASSGIRTSLQSFITS